SLLLAIIGQDPSPNPFIAEQILVQSPGMSQWLKMEIAQEQGVAANLDFPLPSTFIWQMFAQVLPDVPKRSAFNKEAMTWRIMKLLPRFSQHPDFASLTDYLAEDVNQVRLYQLSAKIADTFDGYLVYRPEWIEAWEKGETVEALQGEQFLQSMLWQPILWQAIYQDTLDAGFSKYHRANLYQDFIQALDDAPQGSIHGLPERLFVFGITALPPRYLDALKALGKHIQVHFMLSNPCRYYWGDIKDRRYLAKLVAKKRQKIALDKLNPSEFLKATERDDVDLFKSQQLDAIGIGDASTHDFMDDEVELSVDLSQMNGQVGNGLLASMGKQGRELLYLLSDFEGSEIDVFVDLEQDSLLKQIQSDILELREHQDDSALLSSTHKVAVAADDPSLQIHACHSPMREVEVLHDQLLDMFNADPSLTPRDVIVMVADINAYSYAISAVFGNATHDRYIPYTISDRSADQENPVLNAFIRLLELPQSRMSASDLLTLLETPAMLRRFNLSDDDFLRAMSWVKQVGIRWGLDADTAAQFELPQQAQNTWLFGIERMLMGYAMPEAMGIFQGQHAIASFDEVQGLDAQLAGKLARYVRLLRDYQTQLSGEHTTEKWQQLVFDLLDDFFEASLDDELALTQIRSCVTQLLEQRQSAGVDSALSREIVLKYVDQNLSQSRVSQRFLAGQVNFCTLMPMRSIPFKVVCLLGMNDGVYPRQVTPETFDLIQLEHRAGDRSRRDDDRYLFLEAIVSAQRYLYISYVGQSIVDNQAMQPSVLVSELLDYCHQNYVLEGDEQLETDASGDKLIQGLTTVHAPVPYSPNQFDPIQPKLQSYASEWLAVAQGGRMQAPEFIQALPSYLDHLTQEDGAFSLELKTLQHFYHLPVRHFFQNRLHVYFQDALFSQLEDTEPFEVAGLERYALSEHLLSDLLSDSMQAADFDFDISLAKALTQIKAKGQLPCGEFGSLSQTALEQRITPLFEEIAPLLKQKRKNIEVALSIKFDSQSFHLTGWL
ncbi:MAG: exodeoxyribonuclease V subunit gamma, partial [Vibrio sp.]